VDDWPVKVYLQQRFSNQRSYRKKTELDMEKAFEDSQNKNKGKGKAAEKLDDIFYMGSDDNDGQVE
jgi:hypothetical protein